MIFIYYLYRAEFFQQYIVSSSYFILEKQDIKFFIVVAKDKLMVEQLINKCAIVFLSAFV